MTNGQGKNILNLMSGEIVDRGGIRGKDGKLINHLLVKRDSEKGRSLNVFPPAAEELTVDQALENLQEPQENQDKV